jgi:hypothetical protein
MQIGLGVGLSILLVVPTLFAVWLVWAPHGVELRVDSGRLEITTGPAPISRRHVIDLNDVESVEETRLGQGRRVAGTSLPGYCVGRFRYDGIGSVWQATDCSRDVVILRRVGDRPVVLTPPDPADFQRSIATGEAYRRSQPPPDTGRGWLLLKIFVLLMPLVGLLVPLIFFVAPARLSYRVESGGLAVTTLFGIRRFPTAGGTARPHTPRIGLRLWGTGAPGYYTGTYRVDGENTKVYTTSTGECVLIQGPGVRVLVNPEDRDGFLEAMHSMGGTTA